jgi:hypothetical protein
VANFNGGVVNLGWLDNSPGDYGFIDGLYVVKTDWFTKTSTTFKADDTDPVAHQNNAVIASMMVPWHSVRQRVALVVPEHLH